MEQRILITGAGSGIGRAVARRAGARGASVAVLDVDEAAALRTAELASGDGARQALAVRCDVGDETAVESAVRAADAELGGLTGAFANAGIEVNAAVDQLSVSDWERVHVVNATGVFLTCRAVIRRWRDAGVGGSIVCSSSPSAFVGFAGGGNAAYAASKGAVSAFVRSIAIDVAAAGIRVNAVVPGATDTPMLFAATDGPSREEAHRTIEEGAAREIPLGRLARPDEIAAAVIWLLSEEASYVTGSHLVCDGGLMAKSANTI